MSDAILGLLHPGAMGASVGAAASTAGADVLWASEGRSEATRARAERAGLEDRGSLAELAKSCDVLLCVCPPHAAEEQARAVARQGFGGVYVDANAVAPETARKIALVVEGAGARFVDAGIVGPPAQRAGTTRLYLSGAAAASVAAVFAGSLLEAIPIDGGAGAASALKLCYAAYTKGSAALLTAIRSLAIHEGVDAELVAEWQRSIPELPGRSEAGARATAPKAWRFAGEMEEIAATFATAGLPDGFHRAAAEIYTRLERYKDAEQPPSLEEIARAVRRGERHRTVTGWKPTGQRIAPQQPDEWDEHTRAALGQTRQSVARLSGDDAEAARPLHILTTLAHHSELLASFIGFASTLTLKGRLTRRDAEIASLRASWNCRSDFEWGHHRLYGLAAGLSEGEIADVAVGAEAPRWSEVEAALIRAADELHVDRAIGDATWETLAAHYDEAQLIELLFTVGQYTTLSSITNTLRIELEPHLPGLPPVSPRPDETT